MKQHGQRLLYLVSSLEAIRQILPEISIFENLTFGPTDGWHPSSWYFREYSQKNSGDGIRVLGFNSTVNSSF